MTGPADAALTIDGLTVAFDGAPVLDGVTLRLRRGRTLALVGESGSGKSLTALSVLGLAPPGAERRGGAIRLDGLDLATLDERGLRRIRGTRVALVFQEPGACLNPLMTVGSQIAEALSTRRVVSRPEAVCRLLAEVGLDDPERRRHAYPHELSGGQQQRVVIAMALAGAPEVLVADEPTTALDVTVEAQILELLRRLQRERRMAMLLVSHDLGLVAARADDVAVLRQGHIVEQGEVSDVLAAPRHPYTMALLACRPATRPPRTRLPTVTEVMELGRVPPPAAVAAAPPADDAPALVVEDLTVDYRRGLGRRFRALHAVSLRLVAGGALGLVGESGSGKSTVARVLAGLVPATGGRVAVLGRDALRPPPADRRELRRRCQLVFQDPYASLNPRLRVADILGEPLQAHGLLPRRGGDRALARLLDEVGLPVAHLCRFAHELSGGQRQRVAIARALGLGPEILICDEITSALDVSTQAQVLNLLLRLQGERRLSLLFISHDLAVVRHVCDHVVVLRQGRVVEQGDTDTVLRQPKTAYARALVDAAGLPGAT